MTAQIEPCEHFLYPAGEADPYNSLPRHHDNRIIRISNERAQAIWKPGECLVGDPIPRVDADPQYLRVGGGVQHASKHDRGRGNIVRVLLGLKRPRLNIVESLDGRSSVVEPPQRAAEMASVEADKPPSAKSYGLAMSFRYSSSRLKGQQR